MKRIITICAAVFAVALGVPAVADAHHIDHNASYINCTQASGQDTLNVLAAYRQFEDYNKPVQTSIWLNGALTYHEWITWSGPDYNHPWSKVVQPGSYDVKYWAGWANNSVTDYIEKTVSCPAPPVPPPVVTPVPTPPPVVTPTPSTPPTPPVPPHVTPKFKCPHIRLIMPNPNTLAGRHGVHDFGGRCSKGKIVSTTMYVTATGPRNGDMRHGRRIVCGTVRLHAKGNTIHNVWLADESIWCHLDAWGTYRLKFVFRVRFHDHVYTCVRHAHFLDHDPHGMPGR